MDFDTYFDQLVLREGEWLRPAREILKTYWPHVPSELERAAIELYESVFGKPSDNDVPKITEWFYRANEDLNHQRPIDLMRTPEGARSIRAIFERMSYGSLG